MQVKMENGSSSSIASRVEVEESLENLSISELITRLRTAFEKVDFDLVEEALEKKETKLKSENELLLRRIDLEQLEVHRVENELKKCKEELEKSKEQCEEYKALSKKGKRAQEMHEKLLEKVKKNVSHEESTVAELRQVICKLNVEKHRAESELDTWKSMFEDLSERVSPSDKVTKLKEKRNVRGYTSRESRADKEAVVIDAPRGDMGKNSAESSPSQKSGNTHFTSVAGNRELQSNLNKVFQGESGESMTSHAKQHVRKKQREGTSTVQAPQTEHPYLDFGSPVYWATYAKLQKRSFVESRFLDWDALRHFGLAHEIEELINVGAWRDLFSITEPTYKELSLEFLSTFHMDNNPHNWDKRDAIKFRLAGIPHQMSITQFSVEIGLYSPEFVATKDYRELLTSLPVETSEYMVWRRISRDSQYNPSRSKASTLHRTSWRVVHSLLSRTLTGRGNSHGVVGLLDIFYLYSMIERVSIHLGHAVATFLRHQAQDKHVGKISCGPYITRLARRLGHLDGGVGNLTKVSMMAPIKKETLRNMGIQPLSQTSQPTEPSGPHSPLCMSQHHDATPSMPFPQ